ncbi:MAG TPA: transporter substrate-binding domain-containing protein [Rhizobiaceae bacterium]
MKNLRRGIAGATAVFMLAATTGYSYAGCLDDVRNKGVIVSANGQMGTKPFVWKNDQSGEYEGFEPELFAEIAERIGVPKWDYVITEWTTMIPGLKADRWEIILSGMASTQERIQNAGIIFSRPYFMMIDHVIVLKDSPIQSIDDLKDKTISSTLGTMDSLTAHRLVAEGIAAKVQDFNTFGEPFVALRNKQVDAIIFDQSTFAAEAERSGDLRIVGDPIPYQPKPEWKEAEDAAPYVLGGLAIGMKLECTDLAEAVNTALVDMETDGTRQRILEKYKAWGPEQAKLMK